MNGLANELENKGFNIKIQGRKVSIRLGGLTNPVLITHDLAKDQYVVGTRDLPLGIIYTLLLAFSLYDILDSVSFLSVLLMAICAFGFTSLIITELRARSLREYIEQRNMRVKA